MLFNILLGFVILFVIAFLLINPITKKNDIPSKAELMIVIEWDDESYSDIDLWVQRNDDAAVGFNNKNYAGITLERDDLGMTNDIIKVDGVEQTIRVNREVINVRGIQPGDYYVNIHSYNHREAQPLRVKVTVIDVNPRYKEAYSIEVELQHQNYVARPPAFTVDSEGNIVAVFAHNRVIVPFGKGTAP